MPRINVEEAFWADQRVEVLKSRMGRFAAIGACITAWRLAQTYWNGECKPIPHAIWQQSEMPDSLLSVGLARKTEEGIYVSGSEEAFKWYLDKKRAASVGGRASASIRQANSTSAQASVDECSTDAQASVKQKQPSSSSSSSNSKEEERTSPTAPSPAPVVEVIEYMNKRVGGQFRPRKAATKLVHALLKDGYTVADMKLVVDHKEWQSRKDPFWINLLRPSVLFRPSNFEEYLPLAKSFVAQLEAVAGPLGDISDAQTGEA